MNKITLVIPAVPKSKNAETGSTWQARWFAKGGAKEEKEKFYWLCRAGVGAKYGKIGGFSDAKITFRFPDKKRRDKDNLISTSYKYLQDALKEVGLICDDNNAVCHFSWEMEEGVKGLRESETIIELSKIEGGVI